MLAELFSGKAGQLSHKQAARGLTLLGKDIYGTLSSSRGALYYYFYY